MCFPEPISCLPPWSKKSASRSIIMGICPIMFALIHNGGKNQSPDIPLLCGKLSKAIGEPASLQSVLKYCPAFLNSNDANERLQTRRPTPKGFYQVTEDYLREILIPMPERRSVIAILKLTTRLVAARTQTERESGKETRQV